MPACRIDTARFEPYWAITSHELVSNAARRPADFANRFAECVLPRGFTSPFNARSLSQMDPPEHEIYRRVFTEFLDSDRVSQLEEHVESAVTRTLDRVAGVDAVVDIAEDVAGPISESVLAAVMGFSEQEVATISAVGRSMLRGAAPPATAEQPGGAGFRPANEFAEQMRTAAMDKRRHPADDLGSRLSTATIDGEPLGENELVSNYCLMATAGQATSRAAITGSVRLMQSNPAQLARLRGDRTLVRPAVEEMLRCTSPVISFARTTTRQVRLGDVTIPAGERVALFYAAANHDPEVFDAPRRFLIDRDPNPHLAFGAGTHFCIGAQLARLELRAFWSQLIDRLGAIDLAGEVRWARSSFVGGVARLPVRWTVAPASTRR